MNHSLDLDDFRTVGRRVNRRVLAPLSDSPRGIRDLICFEDDDELLFEGDIFVTEAPPIGIWQRLRNFDLFGHGTSDQSLLWPNGEIPYASEFAVKSLVQEAIAHWHSLTPIRFNEYSGEDDFVTFRLGSRKGSGIGRKGGKQKVLLTSETSVGTAVHEIGHALGLWHEHSRSDRDEHIEVHWSNIASADHVQFKQPVENAQDLGAYDFRSIMHYSPTAFSSNEQPTITTKNGAPIGQRNGLSSGDIQAVRALYPNLPWPQI